MQWMRPLDRRDEHTERRALGVEGYSIMTLLDIVALIGVWLLLSMILVLAPSTGWIDECCDENGIVWVSKNRTFNKLFSIYFPHLAVIYEKLCEKINGEGLLIILVLVSLLTLPMTIGLLIILLFHLLLIKVWQIFCTIFARESDDE